MQVRLASDLDEGEVPITTATAAPEAGAGDAVGLRKRAETVVAKGAIKKKKKKQEQQNKQQSSPPLSSPVAMNACAE